MHRHRLLQILPLLPIALFAASSGCTKDTTAPPAAPTPRIDVPLQVLIIDQPEIAQAVRRLRGDWAELSDGSLTVEEISAEQFSAASKSAESESATNELDADILIYPARYLGSLVEHQRVRPLRRSVLEDEDVALNEVLHAVREGELAYGGEYYALPFGSRVLVEISGGPPAAEGVTAAAEPEPASSPHDESPQADARSASAAQGELGLGQRRFAAAYVLLARAAPLARHPNQVAILFDLETMQPLIDGPPFVRTLQELVATPPEDGSDAPRQGSRPGRWTWWPPESSSPPAGGRSGMPAVTLPASDEVYNPDTEAWETPATGAAQAPLLGANSSIGSVTASSKNAPAAFRLLAWLAERSGGGGRVSVAPYRRGASGELLEDALAQRNGLQIPRILAIDEYLAALNESVRQARQGEVPPEEALQAAARNWDAITERIGRDRQRAAYRKHLNLQ